MDFYSVSFIDKDTEIEYHANTDTQMTEQTLPLTLQECADRLRRDLKLQAPALVTLKRWSASGLLDAAKTVPDGAARAKYSYSMVLQVARKNTRGRVPSGGAVIRSESTPAHRPADVARHDVRSPDSPKSTVEVDLALLSKAIAAELAPIMTQALAAAQKQMFDGLANLDATRKSLMLRYDAEVHGLRDTVASLRLEQKRLSVEAVDVGRLNQQLSRLTDRIESAVSMLKERP